MRLERDVRDVAARNTLCSALRSATLGSALRAPIRGRRLYATGSAFLVTGSVFCGDTPGICGVLGTLTTTRSRRSTTRNRGGGGRRRGRRRFGDCGLRLRGEGICVGHVDAGFVAAHVVHRHLASRELGQLERLGAQVRERRRIAQPHFHVLLHAETALFGRAEQQRLRFDPAHRRGELPAEQFGEQQAAELLVVGRVRLPHFAIGERLGDPLGRHDLEDRRRELARHLERHGHQVRDVPAFERPAVVDVRGQQRVELVAELRHALAQQRGVERHVDARHEHERLLATELRHAPRGVLGERLEPGDCAGHRVLLASQVVVDDLQELAARLRDRLHVLAHVRVVDAELVRTQRAHAVVGTALRVAVDQMVHRRPAVEHELEHGLERNHPGERAERVVFAERMAGEIRGADVGAGLAQARGLRERDRGERDLRELRQVEQALRVAVGHAVRGELLRVVAHHGEDRESEPLARELVGALPHIARGRGLGTLIEHHALRLDALARVDERARHGPRDGGAARDDLPADAARHFEHEARVRHTADALHRDFHFVVELHHAVHVVRPAGDLVVRAGSVERLHGVLRGGREPHAMHERLREPTDRGAAVRRVDRVEVARRACERRHLVRRAHGDAAQHAARRLADVLEQAAVVRRGRGQLVAVRAAADREALGFARHERAVGEVVLHMDRHHAPRRGFRILFCPPVQCDLFAGVLEQFVLGDVEFDEVVEVHGVEQAFDDRIAIDHDRAECRVDRGPCGADECVGRDARRRQVERQRAAGGRLMVGAEVGGERIRRFGHAERELLRVVGRAHVGHRGQRVAGDCGVADAGGGREHAVDVFGQAFAVHHGNRAGRVERHVERDYDIAHRVLAQAAIRIVVPERVEVDVKVELFHARGLVAAHMAQFVLLAATVGAIGRVGRHVADPRDVGARADEVLGAAHIAERREHGLRRGLCAAGHARGHRVAEAAEDRGHRLVDGRDAGHRDRAGDDAHGIGRVARVLGLPQLVLAPPAQQVAVDRRHERHRLGVFAHERREPCLVHRRNHQFGDLRICGEQSVDCGERVVLHVCARGEHRRELALFKVDHARFDALQQVQEPVGVRAVGPREREFGEAARPVEVRHRAQVAEIRLGGGVERVDDLGAAAHQLVGVLHHAHEQTPAARRGVLQFVDVGVQVAQAGRDTAHCLPARHPPFAERREHVAVLLTDANAGRVDEHALDFGARMRFARGHDGRADEHAVDRHVRAVVARRPLAADVVGGALGRADAAARHEHEVLMLADLRVCGEQQVVERLPAVVAARGAAFDLHEDLRRRHRARDRRHLADLLDRAGFERDKREAVRVERADEFHRLVKLRDAGGDDDAVDRRAARALLRHDALRAELQIPQVAIHEHRVELDRVALVELLFELGDVAVEHLGRHLTAARELRPVAGVRCGRHDLGLHGRWRHAGEQHRRLAGQACERGRDLVAVRGAHHARGEARPVLRARGFGARLGERDARLRTGRFDDADARALRVVREQLGKRGARAQIHDPQAAWAVLGEQIVHLRGPIHLVEQHLGGEFARMLGADAASCRPLPHEFHRALHERTVERQRHIKVFERGVEHAAAAHLVGAQLRLVRVLLAHFHRERREVLRVAREHHMVHRVDHGHGDRAARVVHAGDELVRLPRHDALHRKHRCGLAVARHHAVRAGLARAGGADQCGDREDLADGITRGLDRAGVDDRADHVHAEDALRMAEHRARGGMGHVVAELCGVEERAELRERDAFDTRGRVGRGAQMHGIRREAEQIDFAAGRGQQLGAHRREQVVRKARVVVQRLVELWVGGQLGERGRPRRGLAREHQGVRLAGKAAEERCGGHRCSFCVGHM